MKLTSENVDLVFRRCLLKEEEVKGGVPVVQTIKVVGVILNVVLSSERIQQSKEDIDSLLDQLPGTFQLVNGSDSFLNMCYDKEGNQWTDLHQTCDLLVILGQAIDRLLILGAREQWILFPGVVPHLSILKKRCIS